MGIILGVGILKGLLHGSTQCTFRSSHAWLASRNNIKSTFSLSVQNFGTRNIASINGKGSFKSLAVSLRVNWPMLPIMMYVPVSHLSSSSLLFMESCSETWSNTNRLYLYISNIVILQNQILSFDGYRIRLSVLPTPVHGQSEDPDLRADSRPFQMARDSDSKMVEGDWSNWQRRADCRGRFPKQRYVSKSMVLFQTNT